jgi:hypothetical protein
MPLCATPCCIVACVQQTITCLRLVLASTSAAGSYGFPDIITTFTKYVSILSNSASGLVQKYYETSNFVLVIYSSQHKLSAIMKLNILVL